MDNQATESADLTTNEAAALFAEVLDPKESGIEKPEEKGRSVEAEENTDDNQEEQVKEPNETEGEEEPTFTVKIDGKEVEVKLSELKNGYQRQADYTKKTTAVAEQRKAAEVETQKANQERAEYSQKLSFYIQNLQNVVEEQSKTDWQRLEIQGYWARPVGSDHPRRRAFDGQAQQYF